MPPAFSGMEKTKFASYFVNGIANGCKYCVRGEKIVLFMGGKCSRNCWYCSLGNSRKKCRKIFVNERILSSEKDLIDEVKESNAKGMGITGGDPMINFEKTLRLAKIAKQKFDPGFHIHIYLPLNLVTVGKIKKLSKYVDEFRFHPSFLIGVAKTEEIKLLKKISGAIGKKRIGIELPLIPGKKKEIIDFISKIKNFISFLNLNEFEISETNFSVVTKKYKLNDDTCTIYGSKKMGIEILKKLNSACPKLKIHLCTARTKDKFQYVNRLKRHNILPFGNRTADGNVIYFATYSKILRAAENKIKKITKNYFLEKIKKRIIIKMQDVKKFY